MFTGTTKVVHRLIFTVMLLIFCIIVSNSGPLSIETSSSLQASGNERTRIVLGGERINNSTLAAADFDGDGDKEIVAATSGGMIHVISYDGSSWSEAWSRQSAIDINSGLPANEHQNEGRIESSPAIGDINNDGDLEIVITTGGFPDNNNVATNRNGGVLVYEHNGNLSFSLMSGWPYILGDMVGQGPGASDPDGIRDGIWSSPALGDLNGDGDLEIVTLGFDRRIYAWEHTGQLVESWPIQRESGDPILAGGWSSPALGDIDNDGLVEVVVGTDSNPWQGEGTDPDLSKATVWAVNGDSSLVPGFPVETEQIVQSSPALGDIDGDGDLEIVVGGGREDNIPGQGGRKVHAWHGDGSVVSGWPRPTADGDAYASPALADLNGDNVLDVIAGCGVLVFNQPCKLYAWDGNGTALPGFPVQPLSSHNQTAQSIPNAPVVANIDNDPNPEILVVTSLSIGMSVVEHDGTLNSNYTRNTDHLLIAPPIVADLDNDGLLETAAGGAEGDNETATVYIWEETTSASPSNLPWPMFQRDVARTGLYQAAPPATYVMEFPSELRILHPQSAGNTATINATLKNTGNTAFDWSVSESISALSVSPTSGTGLSDQTTIQFTVDTSGLAPDTWHNLGNVTINGTVAEGVVENSPTTTAVWLYVGDIEQLYLPAITK